MTKRKKDVPRRVQKLIYQEAESACPFCGESAVSALEIHHIESRADGGDNEPENLILVCSTCHSKITVGEISLSEILKAKIRLQRGVTVRPTKAEAPSNVIQLDRSSNRGIIANSLTIRAPRRSVKVQPPSGTIAADRDKRNYAKYLIDRYQEFKKADHGVEEFRYALIYKAIQREFKCKWDFIPVERFDDLVAYLQYRIDKTILGKNQKARGHRNYRSFDDFLVGIR